MVLIDGNSLLNRAYFATPVFTTSKGLPTNAIFGFLKLLFKISADLDPRYMVVTFDLHAPTFRHTEYAQYKAGRRPMDDALRVQIPVLKEVLSLMQIKICEKEGYEADDVIGTLSHKLPVHSFIYTGDRDSYQLVTEKTDVQYTKRGVSDLLHLSIDNFREIVGLEPRQIIDLKALMGDKSDNIPGVPGIGEKTAMTLLQNYGTLEGVYEHIDEIKGTTKTKLAEGKESAYFSKRLATILLDAPVEVELSDCVFHKTYSKEVKAKFSELEFKSFLAMDIFEKEENSSLVLPPEKTIAVKKITQPEELNDLLKSLEDVTDCAFDDTNGISLYFDGTEYVIPLRENILDAGFFEEDILPVYPLLFEDEKKNITLFQAKNLMHRRADAVKEYRATIDDVAIMRYLVDSTEKDETLDDLILLKNMPAEQRAYNLFRLKEEYALRLREENAQALYAELEMPLMRVLYDMETQGVCVNVELLNELSRKFQDDIDQLTKEIYELAGKPFNVNSPSQLGVVLFDEMKLPYYGKKNKSGKYSTNVDVLEKISSYEIVQKILRHREISKLKSTYVEGMRPLLQNGKIHTTYTQTITSTGRLSSVNPNLQNIPVRKAEGKELRKLFVASEGNVLLDADYSQIELRLLAHFSGCKELIEAYNKGEDIHALTASQVFHVPLSEVTGDLRRKAKAINFGIIYGMSGFGLSQDLDISVGKAKEYIDAYFARYSDVKAYMDSNVKAAKENGYVTTLLGRKRNIPELKSSNFAVRQFGERAAMNMPLQGSSADIIKIAMIRVHTMLKENGMKAKLILQVHDELIIDCPIEEAEKVSEILKKGMEEAVSLRVPLTVEVSRGNNWYEAK